MLGGYWCIRTIRAKPPSGSYGPCGRDGEDADGEEALRGMEWNALRVEG